MRLSSQLRDRTHDIYIIRALELSCNVITEKPMTINKVRCKAIINTVNKTGKKVRVTFNYQYAPHKTRYSSSRSNWPSQLRSFRVGSEYQPWSRLLPSLAPRHTQCWRSSGTQINAPLRPHQLLATLTSRLRHGSRRSHVLRS